VVLAPLPVGGYEAWLLPVITALAGVALVIELYRALNVVVLAAVASAGFQSLYGLANYAAGNAMILGTWEGGMRRDSVMGTFYSRNQLAGYLAVALPVGVA